MSPDIASGQSEAAGAPTKNDSTYLTPPKEIVDIIDITPEPSVSTSPDSNWMLYLDRDSMPDVADLARRRLALAGIRIDPVTNGPFQTDFNRGISIRPRGKEDLIRIPTASPTRIDRVSWARDRQGEFSDRLATAYRIEVETDSGDWIAVADASDRKPFEGRNPTADEWELPPAALAELDPRSRQQAQALLDERLRLERAIAGTVASQQAFAGIFRKPDRIHLLRRGDPEQPGPEVTPSVPEVLGTVRLPADAPEPERRQALARWLISALTAGAISPKVRWYSGTMNSGSYPKPPMPPGTVAMLP